LNRSIPGAARRSLSYFFCLCSGLFFPSAILALLPIGRRKTPLFHLFPLSSRVEKFVLIVAIEEGNRAGIGGVRFRKRGRHLHALDENPQRRAIGVFKAGRQIDRLEVAIAIAGPAMREKTRLRIGPE